MADHRSIGAPYVVTIPARFAFLFLCLTCSVWADCSDEPVDNVPNSQQCEIRTSDDLTTIREDVTGLSLLFPEGHQVDLTKEGSIPTLHKLSTLKMDLTHVSELGEGLFVNVNQLEKLTMHKQYSRPNTPAMTLPNRVFKGLTNLTSLSLAHMKIGTMEPHSLRDLFSLTTLDLTNNVIRDIPLDSFADCTHLYSAVLYNNGITDLGRISFSGLSSLHSLDLSGNQLTIIKQNQLSELSGLNQLNMEYSFITEIELGAFQGVSSLETLYLGENQITTLKEGTFQELSTLRLLHLNDNPIRNTDTVFVGLNALKELRLDNLNISEITSASFSGLKKLVYLNIGSNSLSILTDNGAFIGLNDLTELNCANNDIHSLHADTFEGLVKLQKLDVSQNDLTTLPNGLFNHIPVLDSLSLAANYWDCDDVGELSRWYSTKLEENGHCDPDGRSDVFEDGDEVNCYTPDNNVKLSSIVGENAQQICLLTMITTMTVVVSEKEDGISTGVKVAIIAAAIVLALIIIILVIICVLCRSKKHGMWTPTKTKVTKKVSKEENLQYKARGKTATKTPSVYWDGATEPTAMDHMDNAYENYGFNSSAMEGDSSLAPKHRGDSEKGDRKPPSYDVVAKSSVDSLHSDFGSGAAANLRQEKVAHLYFDNEKHMDLDDQHTEQLKPDRMRLEMKESLGHASQSDHYEKSESGKQEKDNAAYMIESPIQDNHHGDDDVFNDQHGTSYPDTAFPAEEVKPVHRKRSISSEHEQDYQRSTSLEKHANGSISYIKAQSPPHSPTYQTEPHSEQENFDNLANYDRENQGYTEELNY